MLPEVLAVGRWMPWAWGSEQECLCRVEVPKPVVFKVCW